MAKQHSFKESILIPVAKFKELTSNVAIKPSKILSSSNVLYDQTLPPDVKLKIYDINKNLIKTKESEKTTEVDDNTMNTNKRIKDIDMITNALNIDDSDQQAKIRNILNTILEYPHYIYWNDKLEINIDGHLYLESNIIGLLKYLLKISEDDENRPTAYLTFITKLQEIGIPAKWLIKPKKKGKPHKSAKQDIGSPMKTRGKAKHSDIEVKESPQLSKSTKKPLSDEHRKWVSDEHRKWVGTLWADDTPTKLQTKGSKSKKPLLRSPILTRSVRPKQSKITPTNVLDLKTSLPVQPNTSITDEDHDELFKTEELPPISFKSNDHPWTDQQKRQMVSPTPEETKKSEVKTKKSTFPS